LHLLFFGELFDFSYYAQRLTYTLLRRSREDILYGILKSCSSDSMSTYRLMVSLNLSHKSLKSCLEQLARSNLITIRVEQRRKTVITTREGMKAVSLYRDAISTLKRGWRVQRKRNRGNDLLL